MNLNPQTIEVLNNYQTINSNVALGEPGFVRTMSVSKTLMAKTNIPDQFPYEFGIYDLGEFLACINMFDNPTLAFDENKKHLIITDGVTTFKYFFSDKDILTIPTKDIDLECDDVKFTLTHDQLTQLRKASATLRTNQLSVRMSNTGSQFIEAVVVDKTNPTSNQFTLNVPSCSINTTAEFDFVFDMNNFKFINSDSYEFGIDKKLIASVLAGDTRYWIALDKTTTYKE